MQVPSSQEVQRSLRGWLKPGVAAPGGPGWAAAPGTGLEEDNASPVTKGTPGCDPPTHPPNPLPPTTLHPSKALPLAPALSGPTSICSSPGRGRSSTWTRDPASPFAQPKPRAVAGEAAFSCGGAAKTIGGDTAAMSHHICLGKSPACMETHRQRPTRPGLSVLGKAPTEQAAVR